MHRSGTSGITAGVEALGFHLGGFDNYTTDENPRGYYENKKHWAMKDPPDLPDSAILG